MADEEDLFDSLQPINATSTTNSNNNNTNNAQKKGGARRGSTASAPGGNTATTSGNAQTAAASTATTKTATQPNAQTPNMNAPQQQPKPNPLPNIPIPLQQQFAQMYAAGGLNVFGRILRTSLDCTAIIAELETKIRVMQVQLQPNAANGMSDGWRPSKSRHGVNIQNNTSITAPQLAASLEQTQTLMRQIYTYKVWLDHTVPQQQQQPMMHPMDYNLALNASHLAGMQPIYAHNPTQSTKTFIQNPTMIPSSQASPKTLQPTTSIPYNPDPKRRKPNDMEKLKSIGDKSLERTIQKRKLSELLQQIDPNERLDPDVDDIILDVADEFLENLVSVAAKIAKHRGSDTIEIKDLVIPLDKQYNIRIPGYSEDMTRLLKKAPHPTATHMENVVAVKKAMRETSLNDAHERLEKEKVRRERGE